MPLSAVGAFPNTLALCCQRDWKLGSRLQVANLSSNKQWNCGVTLAVLVFRTNGTLLECEGEWVMKIPTFDLSLHLLWACCCCSLSSRTYTGDPNGWKCFRFTGTSDPENLERGELMNLSGRCLLPSFSPLINLVGRLFRRLT